VINRYVLWKEAASLRAQVPISPALDDFCKSGICAGNVILPVESEVVVVQGFQVLKVGSKYESVTEVEGV